MGRRSSAEEAGGVANREDAQVPLALQYGQGVVVVARSYDHLVEDRVHGLGHGCVQHPVDGHDAAKGADGVSLVGKMVRLGNGFPAGQAAGVVVLDYGDRGLGKVGHGAPGGVCVHQVVVGEFTAVQLLGAGDPGQTCARRNVKRPRLVRILAVTQPSHLVQRDGQAVGQPV